MGRHDGDGVQVPVAGKGPYTVCRIEWPWVSAEFSRNDVP